MQNQFSTNSSTDIIIGVDEAGRGSLAGPVVAAAVAFPAHFQHSKIKDSKQLSATSREKLRKEIIHQAIEWHLGVVEREIIDQINIAQAAYLAMFWAIKQMRCNYKIILIDGKYFPFGKEFSVPVQCIIKGDSKELSISAASILAKTFRDDIMCALHRSFPQYFWQKNKGYPTKQHKQALKSFGISPYHRRSFKLIDPSLF